MDKIEIRKLAFFVNPYWFIILVILSTDYCIKWFWLINKKFRMFFYPNHLNLPYVEQPIQWNSLVLYCEFETICWVLIILIVQCYYFIVSFWYHQEEEHQEKEQQEKTSYNVIICSNVLSDSKLVGKALGQCHYLLSSMLLKYSL